MNEQEKTPIERLADLLAEMTYRAMEAERQRDAARDDSDQWYRNYKNVEGKYYQAKDALSAKIEENKKLQKTIGDYIEKIENGEHVDE
jgi:hypothetical protein